MEKCSKKCDTNVRENRVEITNYYFGSKYAILAIVCKCLLASGL